MLGYTTEVYKYNLGNICLSSASEFIFNGRNRLLTYLGNWDSFSFDRLEQF